MCINYVVICLCVATVMAEPPVFLGLQHQQEREFNLNAQPNVFQQLPQEQSFSNYLPPSVTYGAPGVPVLNHDIKSADYEIPQEDSYNAAFLHSASQQHQTGYNHGPSETQIHKHIFVHVPPKDFEQEDDIQPRLIHQTGAKQKHYKIVFIKAPEAPRVHTPIVSPLAQNEEKTLIYVLHKKPETHPNIVIPTPEPTIPSKPEVYFIKYKSKTQEAPVYGPPPAALNEIQSRQADDNNNIAKDDFMPLDLQQNELEATTSQPQYAEGMDRQQSQAKVVTEAIDFYNDTTASNSINEDTQATTVEPINQYLTPETTLAPIVAGAMNKTAYLPAVTYGAPKPNRFFIKRRK